MMLMLAVKKNQDVAPASKSGIKMLWLAVFLLATTMAFTGILNYMTFQNNYNKSLVNTYAVVGNELVRKIEYALHYGKPMDNFYGMGEILAELKDIVPDLEHVNVVSPRGLVMYNMQGFVENEKSLIFQPELLHGDTNYRYAQQKHYIFLKINGPDNNIAAILEMVFPRESFHSANVYYKKQLALYWAGIAGMTFILLGFILLRTKLIITAGKVRRKKFLVILIIVLGSAQLLYGGANYFLFKKAYGNLAVQSTGFVQKTVAKNITNLYDMGIDLDQVEGVEQYLDKIMAGLPLIDGIHIIRNGSDADQGLAVIDPASGRAVARVRVDTSDAYISLLMREILLDMVTILVISILFMVELTILAIVIVGRRKDPNAPALAKTVGFPREHAPQLIRGLIFVINICVFMSITFVPIVMRNLYQPLLGLPRDVVLGLPLSAEMLGGIVAILVSGLLIERKGWRVGFYFGVLLLMAGNLLSGLGPGAVSFIISRAVAGLGIGFVLMTLRSLAVSLPQRNIAIAEFSAGSIAGLNCGAVIGGMLADKIGYQMVFCLSAGLVLLSYLYVYRFMINLEIMQKTTSDISAGQKFVNFISDPKALAFALLIFAPFFIAGAFLDYYFPLFASGSNLTQSDISRGFLLNGLCVIYLGPVLTGFATRYLGDKKSIVYSSAIVICALAAFIIWGSVTAAFVTVILLGLAESFGVAMQTSYFLNLKSVRDLETSKAIAYFSVMVNASRMVGPIIFGLILTLGLRTGVGLMAMGLLALLMLFIFVSRGYQQQTS